MARSKNTTPSYWHQQFAAQTASGLNAADYLRREGIRSSQWYRWRKLLREDSGTHATTLVLNRPGGSTGAYQIQIYEPSE